MSSPTPEQPLRITAYTTEQVAGLFQVTPQEIVDWCNRGLFPFFRLPDRRRRHPRPAVDQMLSETNRKQAGVVPRPPLVPIQYAMERFEVSRSVVSRWLRLGLLSYIDMPMVGVRLFQEEVDALFDSSTVSRIVDYELLSATHDLSESTVDPDGW